jgi:hypothetical protein
LPLVKLRTFAEKLDFMLLLIDSDFAAPR